MKKNETNKVEDKLEEVVEIVEDQGETKTDVESVVETNEDTKKTEGNKQEEVVESNNKKKFIETRHNFDPGDIVYVADFRNVRDNAGYTKIENQFRFAPLQGEIERVIITKESGVKIIQYKLKNKAGSLYDEEDVCKTLEEANKLCIKRNRG